jgi:hypothetical protein
MISGIVPFEEIVESIKDVTGYENMRPLHDKIRRFIFKAEEDIGAGGLVIRKKKQYTIGDGFYDGTTIIMPDDFIGEYSYKALSSGVINGRVLTLNCYPGPEELDMYYMGFLLDDKGNPFTTRNHLDAIVAFSVFRLYSSRYFLGKGNINQYREYKTEFNDFVMAARGNDAFPTEEQWEEIGKIMHGGMFQALSDCGVSTICSENTLIDGGGAAPDDLITAYPCTLVDLFYSALNDKGPTEGLVKWGLIINTSSSFIGTLKYKFDLTINSSSSFTGTLTSA